MAHKDAVEDGNVQEAQKLSVMDVIKRQRQKGEAKDKSIEGLWYDEIDIDEAFDLLRKFRKLHMFFDDYTDDDFIHLSDVMDILKFKEGAPVTKEGEISTWVALILAGKINVFVKGTQVAVMKSGAIIGDTGYLEGGRRSADLYGAAGGGIIALLPFEKLDLLYETHGRLAYKLAVSFGGAVVRKLRITLGKVYQKDNVARAGSGIGRRRINDTRIGFARDATYLETLTQKEVLYLAKMKKLKKPERQRQMKEKKYREKMEKENKGLKSQLKGCRQELNDYIKREQQSKYLLSITMAALERYEQKYADAFPIVQKYKIIVPALQSEISTLQEQLEDSEKARRDKFGDLEDSIQILKQKEQVLLKNLHIAKRNEKLTKTRLGTANEEYQRMKEKLENNIQSLQRSFEGVDVTMEKQENRIKTLTRKLETERAISLRLENSWKIKARWQSAAVKALSKRIHTVRKVAKIHNAWWKQLNHINLLRFKRMDEMIADWQQRDDEKTLLLRNADDKIKCTEQKWSESKRQLAGMTFAAFTLLLKACKNKDLHEAAQQEIKSSFEKNKMLERKMEETVRSMKKIAVAAKSAQIEAHSNVEEIVSLKSRLNTAERDIAWKNLEMYKKGEQSKQEHHDIMSELRNWRGALDTKKMEVKSNLNEIDHLKHQLKTLRMDYERTNIRRLDLENRFGHLLPEYSQITSETFHRKRDHLETFGGSAVITSDDMCSNVRKRPWTASSMNLSLSLDSRSGGEVAPLDLSLPETSSSLSTPNKPPPYYPDNKHRQAQPNYSLGSSKSMSYYDNARNREKNGIVGMPRKASKLHQKYVSTLSSRISKREVPNKPNGRRKHTRISTTLPSVSKSVGALPILKLKLPTSPNTVEEGRRQLNSPLQGFDNVY